MHLSYFPVSLQFLFRKSGHFRPCRNYMLILLFRGLLLFLLLVYLLSNWLDCFGEGYPPKCKVSNIASQRRHPRVYICAVSLWWQWFQESLFVAFPEYIQLFASTSFQMISLLFSTTLKDVSCCHSLIQLNVGPLAGVGFEACHWGLLWPQKAILSCLFLFPTILSGKVAGLLGEFCSQKAFSFPLIAYTNITIVSEGL